MCYKEGYKDLIVRANDQEIVLQNGAVLPFHTDLPKNSWDEKINNADLQTQLSQPYSLTKESKPQYLDDPGRLRYQPFFEAMYGKSKKEIEKNLVKISWPTSKGNINIRVTKINDVDKKLYLIGQEIAKLPKNERKWADNAQTYEYRTIKDTNRLSMHSFGIAIDISPTKTQYWKDEAKEETAKIGYKNSVPLSVVHIFEKYGFIWGGKWYHYDTMHFEYRPEILAPSCVELSKIDVMKKTRG
jgi:hypothetical protein